MMVLVRGILTVVGILCVAMGVLWMAQGTGVFPYPASSFMINQSDWIWKGGVLAAVGLAVVWSARRFLR